MEDMRLLRVPMMGMLAMKGVDLGVRVGLVLSLDVGQLKQPLITLQLPRHAEGPRPQGVFPCLELLSLGSVTRPFHFRELRTIIPDSPRTLGLTLQHNWCHPGLVDI